jgi:hypothetical protein
MVEILRSDAELLLERLIVLFAFCQFKVMFDHDGRELV